MQLLLDTHIALWAIVDDATLAHPLVVQALHEPMHLITHDGLLKGYGEMVMVV